LIGQSVTFDKDKKVPEVTKCDRSDFRLILDVGHTAEAHGAMSARNVPEYDFNLRLAQEIDDSLIENGFTRTVLLVTRGPAKRSLHDRVAAANHLSAGLFLSIHHDSVPDSFLQEWEFDGKPSHFSDRFKGYSLFVSHENRNLKPSLQFATLVGEQLKERGFKYASHYTEEFMGRHRRELLDADVGVYRYDELVVLRETQMPAVLLEAGSIINRDEELLMNSPEHRASITTAVTAAVEGYCGTASLRPEIGGR
jgi:N-acetylmuramoyl-L-alanine amidase